MKNPAMDAINENMRALERQCSDLQANNTALHLKNQDLREKLQDAEMTIDILKGLKAPEDDPMQVLDSLMSKGPSEFRHSHRSKPPKSKKDKKKK